MKWFPSHLLDDHPKTMSNSNPSIQDHQMPKMTSGKLKNSSQFLVAKLDVATDNLQTIVLKRSKAYEILFYILPVKGKCYYTSESSTVLSSETHGKLQLNIICYFGNYGKPDNIQLFPSLSLLNNEYRFNYLIT